MIGVLGLDSGIEYTGYGVVTLTAGLGRASRRYDVAHRTHGVIKTAPSKPIEERCLRIFSELRSMLDGDKFLFVGIENYFVGPNRKAGANVLRAQGACLVACAAANVGVTFLNPTTVKKHLTGRGNAKKDEVRAAVTALMKPKEPIVSEHEADALAVAVTLLTTLKAPEQLQLARYRLILEELG